MNIRKQFACIFALMAFAIGASAQPEQSYPSKAVRLIVTYPPGGATDIMARMLGEKLTQRLGQQIIIDNRGGANGNIGMELAVKAPADGYTLVLTTVGTWAVNPSLYKLTFDVTKDFAPIMQISSSPGVLVVHPSTPVKSVKELVALAKAQPNKLHYGSAGIGGFGHICGAIFTLMSGTHMVHVPYKGAGPAQVDLLAGQIEVLFNDAIPTMPYLRSGRMRGLAVTSIKRMPILSELPTIDEAGVKGYDNSSWMAIGAPTGTPREIIAKLNNELAAVLKLPDIQEKAAAAGAVIVGGSPEHFGEYLRSEIAKFRRIVKDASITLQ
jgi:tripartite-type tricarboxylate transporter receptor subunit TctC